jgi:hypothetical protein
VSLSSGNSYWRFYDNLFDHISLSQDSATLSTDYNAYIGPTNRLRADTHYVTNATFTYTNGPLGRFYHHTTSLVDAGSRNSTNAGLYHFTTRASLLKETNTVVDIGFHYVVTDANGTPLDLDGDGVPDYYEDTNGNGSVELTEIDWKNADTNGDGVNDGLELLQGRNPRGGTLTDTNNLVNLRVFTPLK